jgi:hypothetical protein
VKRAAALLALLTLLPAPLLAQDTALVQGGIYQRPFIFSASRTAVGGYLEANGSWFRTDGISEGPSFEVRRFNIFLYSGVGRRLKFTSELEFEHGTEEIALETALVDFVITPSLVIRAGVLLPPIGGFNVNHDGPRYEFIERPLVSTEIIPSTLSEAGLGVHGRLAPRGFALSYDLYLSNGLGSGIILNDRGRTHLPSGKGEGLVAEDENGSPAFSGRIAARSQTLGEIGLSHYRGVYNQYRVEGVTVDEQRWVSLSAVDVETALGPVAMRGEAALANVDLPADLAGFQGDQQWGFYLDAVVPVWHPKIRGLESPVVNLGVRFDRADFNMGEFQDTGQIRGDDQTAVTVAIGFRPVNGTVFRLNYRHDWIRDLAGNPPVRRAGVLLGVATYF